MWTRPSKGQGRQGLAWPPSLCPRARQVTDVYSSLSQASDLQVTVIATATAAVDKRKHSMHQRVQQLSSWKLFKA